ncbi:hypothetical protein TorRG33x02_219970 [Trema orientale]|uniref:Uncharacterized protein n=1 Tax=Trema orientale TaxID=63057 RepID=A0A2P5E9M2_TREOI|nr:hypothetical protein TorRG33x02_219970 [Trema orientale]
MVWRRTGFMVRHVKFKTKNENSNFVAVAVAAFHPNNTDVIFMSCNCEIYKFDFGEDEYKRFGEFLGPGLPKRKSDYYLGCVKAFTLVYPPWPTPIPTLPEV